MKLSKFMCAAFAAAMVLVGCNKENETPVDDGSNGFKSCVLQLENVALTKLPSTDYISNNTAVTLNSFQVFFSDGTSLYQAYESDGTTVAATYFDSDLTATKQFHYLPHEVNEVLVIGNFQGEINLGTVGEGKKYSLSRQELRAQINQLKIEEQQDPKNLKLFGVDQALSETTDHTGQGHGNVVYAANVTLKPAVARFEITGFKYDASDGSGSRLYDNVKIQQLTARTYFEKATVAISGESALTVTGEQLDAFNEYSYTITDGNAPSYFNAVADKGWFSDGLNITLEDEPWEVGNTNPTTAAPYTTVDPANKLYSYHVFPGQPPQFLAKILANSSGADVPLYLKTSSLRTQDGILDGEKVVAGNIYRLSFNFVDTSFEQPEKCVDLTVSVAQWSVNILTPIF